MFFDFCSTSSMILDQFWLQNGRRFAVESGFESITKPKLTSKGHLDLTWDYFGSEFEAFATQTSSKCDTISHQIFNARHVCTNRTQFHLWAAFCKSLWALKALTARTNSLPVDYQKMPNSLKSWVHPLRFRAPDHLRSSYRGQTYCGVPENTLLMVRGSERAEK